MTISSVDVDGVTVDPVTVPNSIDTVEVTFRAADPAWSVLPAHLLGDAGSWRDWGTFTLVVDDVAPASIFSGRPALLNRDLLIDGAVGDGGASCSSAGAGDNFAIRTLADDGSTVLSTRDVGVNEYDVALIQTPTGHIIEVGNMTNAEFTARVPVIVCMEGCS